MDIVRVSEMAARECVRQKVGLDRVGMLLEGYEFVYNLKRALSVGDLNMLGLLVEPSNKGRLRTTPVTFQNGGGSASPDTVTSATYSLVDNQIGVDVDDWIKQFLWVHPFTDGNGRVAWVLWNWMHKTMREPNPLPDFFGENSSERV